MFFKFQFSELMLSYKLQITSYKLLEKILDFTPIFRFIAKRFLNL